jgi:hypothetical protein
MKSRIEIPFSLFVIFMTDDQDFRFRSLVKVLPKLMD